MGGREGAKRGRNWEISSSRRGGAGRREEEGQSTRGPAARRDGTPHRPTAQWRVRQAARPAGSLAAPSANDPARASAARASERTYMAVGWVLSRMCSAARRAVPPQPTLPRRASASRAPPAVSCATRRSTTPIPLPHPRACVRAPCVRGVHAQRGVRSGEARRLCVLRACVPLPIRARPGAGGANEAQGPTTQLQLRSTCVRTSACRPG